MFGPGLGYPDIVSTGPEERPSKTQLDKLGDRLRAGTANEADLRALDDYRRSFRSAYDEAFATVKTVLGLESSGRPAKTTAAIIDKLRRQPVRLTQIQDISGLRVIVDGIREQNRILERLRESFGRTSSDDRRIKPSHGYRAVHVIASIRDRVVEIQIRTQEQHLWAEISEKLADIIDPRIKYGGGPERVQQALFRFSTFLAAVEPLEESLSETEWQLMALETQGLESAVSMTSELTRLRLDYGEKKAALKSLKENFAKMLGAFYDQIKGSQL